MSVVAGISFGIACFQVKSPLPGTGGVQSEASMSPEVFNFCANSGVCTKGTACFTQGGAAILQILLGFNLTIVQSPVS